MQMKEGRKIPHMVFKVFRNNQWTKISTTSLFKNKKVVVFSLPGAYTPTCSSAHVPGYKELTETFYKNGVDKIVCIAVNDPFVMNQWQNDQSAGQIIFLPDGNGEFTEKMGLLLDLSAVGLGKRSKRYSMLVRNGVIKKIFVEKDASKVTVSDARKMLKHINPKAAIPPKVALFTKKGCPHCARAKKLLDRHKIFYEEIELGGKVTPFSLRAVSGADATPQVFFDGKRIGGADDLEKYLSRKKK